MTAVTRREQESPAMRAARCDLEGAGTLVKQLCSDLARIERRLRRAAKTAVVAGVDPEDSERLTCEAWLAGGLADFRDQEVGEVGRVLRFFARGDHAGEVKRAIVAEERRLAGMRSKGGETQQPLLGG